MLLTIDSTKDPEVFKQATGHLRRQKRFNPESDEENLLCLIRVKQNCQQSLGLSPEPMTSIRELIEKVEIDYQDGDGDTFLHAALKVKDLDVANLILKTIKRREKGVAILNSEGKTPYRLAKDTCSSFPEWKDFIEELRAYNNDNSDLIIETLYNDDYEWFLTYADLSHIGNIEYKMNQEGRHNLEVLDLSSLAKQLRECVNTMVKGETKTFIVNIDNRHWVALVITHDGSKLVIYHVDSLDFIQELDGYLSKFKEEVVDVDVQTFRPKRSDGTPQQADGHNCGLFALKNAELVTNALRDGKAGEIGQILSDYMPSKSELHEERNRLANELRNAAINLRLAGYYRPEQLSIYPPPQRKKAKISSELEDSMPKPSAERGSSINSYGSWRSIPSLSPITNDRGNMEVDSEKQTRKRPFTDNQLENIRLKKTKISKPTWDSNLTYTTGGLKRFLHGNNYQLSLLILFAWRYKGNVAFRLGTEVADAGKFDDLVLRYQNDQGETQYCFLQAKHAQHLTEESNLQYEEFFILDDKKDFSLKKYFFSYLESVEKFKDGSIEDFILCTNRNLAKDAEIYFEEIKNQDAVLNLGGKRYKFSKAKRDETVQKLSEVLNKDTRSRTSKKHKDETIGKFLDQLVVAVGQPSGPELGDMIGNEIGSEFNLINDITYNGFRKFMSDWMEYRKKKKEGSEIAYFLTHDNLKEFINKAKVKIAELVSIGPTSLRRREIKEHGITFESEGATIKELKGFLNSNNKKQIFNLVTQETLLGATKVDSVLDSISLYKEKRDSHIFVQLNALYLLKEELIKAFESETDNLLVIECGPVREDIQGLYNDLFKTVRENDRKKVILITKEGNDLANKFKQDFSEENKYNEEKDKEDGFKDLNAESKEKLLDKNVNFQGQSKQLRNLVNNELLEKIIGPDELAELVTSDEIKIGKAHGFSYIRNSKLGRKLQLTQIFMEVLGETDGENTFILGVVGKDKRYCNSLQKELRKKYSNRGILVFEAASVENKFQAYVRKNDRRNIYWLSGRSSELEKVKNVKLELRGLHGNFDTLSEHVVVDKDGESLQIDDLSRVSIIHGEAGIGKTIFLNELRNKHSQSLWIMDIDLSSCPRAVWSSKNFGEDDDANINSFIGVLKALKKLKSESKLEKNLFMSALEGKGIKLGIFFDSFEQVSKSDQVAVLSLLKTLKYHTKVKKLAVATRSYDKLKVEDALSEFAYMLPKLKRSGTSEMFKYFLENKDESYINELIKKYEGKGIDTSLPVIVELVSSNEQFSSITGNTLVELCNTLINNQLSNFAKNDASSSMISEQLGKSVLELAMSQIFGSPPVQSDKSFIKFAQEHAGIGGIFDSNRDTDSPVLRSVFAESQVKMHPAIQGIIKQRRKNGINVNDITKADHVIKKYYFTDIVKPIREYIDQESTKDSPNHIFRHILDVRASRLSLSNFKKKLIQLRESNEDKYYNFLKKEGVLSLAGDYYNGDLVKIVIEEILSQGLKEFDEGYGVLNEIKNDKKESFKKELYGKYGNIRKLNSTFFNSVDKYLSYLSNRVKKIHEISKANNEFRNELLYFAQLGNVGALDVVFSTRSWVYYGSNQGSVQINMMSANINQKEKGELLIKKDTDLIKDVIKNIEQKDDLLSFSVEKKLDYLSLALMQTERGKKEIENDKGGKILFRTIHNKCVIVRNQLAKHYGGDILNELGSDGKAFVHRLVEGHYSPFKVGKYIKYIKRYTNIKVNVLDRSGMSIFAIALSNGNFFHLKAILGQFPEQVEKLLDLTHAKIVETTDPVERNYLATQQVVAIYTYVLDGDKKLSEWMGSLQNTLSQFLATSDWPDHYRFAILQSALGDYGGAARSLRRALELAESIAEPDNSRVLPIKHMMAVTLGKQGKYNEALRLLHEVLEERESILQSGHPDILSTNREIAVMWNKLGDYKGALELLRHVLEKNVLGPDHPDTLSTEHEMAVVYGKLGNYKKALKLLKKVRKKRVEVFGPDEHLDTLSTMCETAVVYGKLGDYRKALQLLMIVTEGREVLLDDDHPDSLSVDHEVALIEGKQGDHRAALGRFDDVLSQREVKLGPDHPDTLSTRHEMAVIWSEEGNYGNALESLNMVLEKRGKVLGEDHPDTLSTEHEMAVIWGRQGDYGNALGLLEMVLDQRKRGLGLNHPDTLSTELELGVILRRQERYDEALSNLNSVVKKRKTSLNLKEDYLDDDILLYTEHEIGMVHLFKGEYKTAFDKFEEVINQRKEDLGKNIRLVARSEEPETTLGKFEEAIKQRKEDLGEILYLPMHGKRQLDELKDKLRELEKDGSEDISKSAGDLLNLIEKEFGLYDRRGCAQRKKRETSIPCVDSRDEENITKEEKERRIKELLSDETIMKIELKELESEINDEVLSRHEEIESVATYDVNKSDVLSNALQSLKLSKMLLLMSQKSEVSIELQEKAYYNALIDIGALIHDHKDHVHGDHLSALESRVHGDHLSALESRVHGNQLFSVAHDLYYLSKSEGNVDKGKLYSDQIKNMIDSYDHIEGKNKLGAILSDMDVKDLFRDRDVEDFCTEAEAYDKEVITIHYTQVFADEAEVYVKVRDNDENYQKVVIGEIASIQNTENYILDEETSGIKLRVDGDKEYTIIQESEEEHAKHYLNIPGGHKVKIGTIIRSFTGSIKEAIHSKLHKLELLASKKDVEEISNAEITDQDYNSVIGEIKQSVLQEGVSENTFNQLKDHLDSLSEKVFAEYISDVEKKLEGHGIEFDRNKFDSAKVKGAKSGKIFLLLMATYDLSDSISDVPTLGRHNNDALKQIFSINGVLDAMDDVRGSLSASYIRSDGKVVTKIPHDSAIGRIVSKVPDHIRKTFVKVIGNPIVKSITFATITYQFGYSIDEIAKGNHHPLNYYWTASSGIKLASMSIMKGISATTKALRWVSAASKVLSRISMATAVADFAVVIGAAIYERMEYVKAMARQVPLTLVDKLEIFFANVIFWKNTEKKYNDTIRVGGYLDRLKRESIKLLKNTNIAGVVPPAFTIVEEYSEIIKGGPTSSGDSESAINYGIGTVRRHPYCQLEERVDTASFYEMVNTTLSVDLSSLNISKTLPMRLWPGKEEVYIVDDKNMKHIPHLTRHEYEKLALRVVSAPLKYWLHEPQCGNIITKKHDSIECNVGKVYRTCQRSLTFSGEPFVIINSTNLSGTILYISGHKALTAAANHPAEMHVPSYLQYDEYEINYTGSKHRTVFVVRGPSYSFLTGESGKGNILVTEISNFKVIVDLQDDHYYKRNMLGKMEGSVYFITNHDNCTEIFVNHDQGDPLFPYCTKGILLLDNVYNYFSNSNSKHRVITHCKTRSINVKNAEVKQGGKDCHGQDYEVRVVNKNNVHYRGLKQAVFIVSGDSNNAKIVGDVSTIERKKNMDVIFANITSIKQLKISEEKEGSYSLNLLANNTQSIVSNVKVDSFEKLVIQVEDSRVKGFVLVQNKSVHDIMKDMKYQILSNLTNVDEGVVQNSKKKLKAVILVSIHSPELSTYSIARDVVNNNNLGITISLVRVEKIMGSVAHEVIVENMYHGQIVADFSRGNIDCKKVIVAEMGQHGSRCIVKFPQLCETDNPVNFTLRVITPPYASAFDNMVDLTECGISSEDVKVDAGTTGIILNSHVNQGSFQVVLDNYLRGPEYQHIAFQFNKGGGFYKVNGVSLKLEPVLLYEEKMGVDYDSLVYYKPDEQGLQIYHNQPNNKNKIGFVDLKGKSILDSDMEIVNGSLVLLHDSNTFMEVVNWNINRLTRKMMFIFNDTVISNAKCVVSNCDPKDIIKEFEEEKRKVSVGKKTAQRKRRHHRDHHYSSHKPLAIGLSNQPEVVTRRDASKDLLQNNKIDYNKGGVISGTSKQSSWINDLFGWVKDSVGVLVGSLIALPRTQSLPKESTSNSKPKVTTSKADLSQVDVNGTILLFDTFIRKFTGQRYISSNTRGITEQKALGYALNIIGEFEKVVNQAALRSGISMHRLNIDFVGMQKEVTKKIMGGKFDEISGIVKSQIEKACPGGEAGCPGKLSPKKFDKFIAQFSKGLLNQSIHQMLHNENNALKMDNIKEPQSSGLSGPRTRLNDVLIASNTRELVAGRR